MARQLIAALCVLLLGCGDSTGPAPGATYELAALQSPIVLGQVYVPNPSDGSCEPRRVAIEGGALELRADGSFTMHVEMWESHGALGAGGQYFCDTTTPRDLSWTWDGEWTRSGDELTLTVFEVDPVGSITAPRGEWPSSIQLDGSARGWGSLQPWTGMNLTTWSRVP